MKIVYLSSSTVPSRAANSIHVMKMCQAFAKAGHNVILMTRDKRTEREPGVLDEHAFYDVNPCFSIVRKRWLPLKGRRFLYGFLSAWHAKRLKPDLVYARNLDGCFFSSLFCLPIMFESHAPIKGRLSEWFFSRIISRVTFQKLVVISNALKMYYESKYPTLKSKIQVAPDAADPVDEKVVPVTLPGKTTRLQVGYIGHLYSGRGIEMIEQLAAAASLWADFHVIGGSPRDIAECQRRTMLLKNIYWHGFKVFAEAERLRVACDILLAPYADKVRVSGGAGDTSLWMSPLKVFEYMAAGKAIICSDISVLREVLKDKRNALLCPASDFRAWLNSLERLRDDSVLRTQLGENAKSDFIAHYTWEARAAKVLTNI